MIRRLGLVLALAVVCPVAAADAAVLDFTLKGLDGRNHRLAEHRGRTTLLVFVAPFCGSCRDFVSTLDESAGALWVVHLGEPRRPYGHGMELMDFDGRLAARLDIGKLPAWLWIDPGGAIVARGSGSTAPPDIGGNSR